MRVIRMFFGAAVIFSVLFTVFSGAGKIAENREIYVKSGYKGIITVWQIDTFEGGVGSRRQFLSARAKEFSKKNEGVLFMVSQHTKESAQQSFKEGVFPDVLSFGAGINSPSAEELPADLFCKSGAVGGKAYAAPWCRGGYVLIKHPKFSSETGEKDKKISSLIVSQGEYNMPLMAALFEGYDIVKYEIMKPFDAYKAFTLGKTPYFLGTQRDIVRLKARGENFSYTPLYGFCDLYQYASATGRAAEKTETAKKFIEYLLSAESQDALKQISMIPVKEGVSVAADLEGLCGKTVETSVSAFFTEEEIARAREALIGYYGGDKSLYLKIKNMVILP